VTRQDTTRSPIPWDTLIAFGLVRLRLSPKDFWALSLRELNLMAAPFAAPRMALPGRTELEALARRYPDGGRDG
jgi:uncharacterized phage protein (TIGR02216 family)